MAVAKKPAAKKPHKEAKPFVVAEHISTRVLIAEHLGEILAGMIGILILICSTIAVITHTLDSNAYAVIIGGTAGGGIGYGAGKSVK